MAVSNDFTASQLDLNGMATIGGPTALVWGPDGRLYVTEVSGDVNILSVTFGDKTPGDGDATQNFYVTEAEVLGDIKDIQNYNDDGSISNNPNRQVTGIDVTAQYDENGEQVFFGNKPAVVIYVTSSDSRIGAGGSGADVGLDTNSGVITRMVEQADGSFETVDIVRGLARSEENHATNGLEVIQELDENGILISERMIVANGGNANTGAPSNNFAGQQETAYSAAILEVDLTQIKGMQVLDDNGRAYVYDIPTLDDPTRDGAEENDPFGGNDGLNGGKLTSDGPVQIYSAGYRNAFDVEVTEDGRVFTYDNGANNNWGGRPAGEDQDGDTDAQEAETGTPAGYISTNYAVEDNNEIAGDFNPANWDGLHEVTRSDDLLDDNGILRQLSAGQGGAQTYTWMHPDLGELQLVYGGHPNPTRAEGARAGLLYSPEAGTNNSLLMVSNADKGNGSSDFLEVVSWLQSIGYSDAVINTTVVAVDPGVTYSDVFAAGFGVAGATGRPTTAGVFSLVEDADGPIGLPVDIDEVVNTLNPIEGDYREAGYTDGSVDTNKGSVNGLAEYTSTILDDPLNGIKNSGSLWATTFNGSYLLIGRNEDGIVETTTSAGRTVAADKVSIAAGGGPLGIAAIGDDVTAYGGNLAFRGTVWTTIYKQNGPIIEIFQPGNPDTNPLLPAYAGQEPSDPTDHDLDGIDHFNDPFDFSSSNGHDLAVGQSIVLDFVLNPPNPDFSGSLGDSGLFGAALDGTTPNRDALTLDDGTITDPALAEDGLFDDGGNLIIGANAPKTQIKVVKDGTAVGTTAAGGNSMRDGLQTGVNIADDVQRLVSDIEIANWTADQAPEDGRKTGIMFGDGTQSNFVRFFFGDIGGGVLGLEVGMEIEDVYTVLGTATDAAFTTALTAFTTQQEKTLLGQKVVSLQLEIADIGGSYEIIARYAIKGETEYQTVALTNGNLPPDSTLRDVLDGTHTISDGDTTAASGAAVGLFAEKDDGTDFTAVDFNEIRIEAFGNEIAATDAAGVGAGGSAEIDTIVYTGTETDLAPLANDVENFDGSASAADYTVTGNTLDNTIKVGAGTNTITTGEGADKVVGTKANLNTDVITDFTVSDKVVITDATLADTVGIEYEAGSAILKLNGVEITFEGPDFADFDPADGPATFNFSEGSDGLEITLAPDETVVYRVNAGNTVAAIDGGIDWIGDNGLSGTPTGGVTMTGNKATTFQNAITDAQDEVDFDNVDPASVPWDLFVNERGQGGTEYTFAVTVGNTYKIEYFYTENWQNIFANGPREFDVSVEGAVPEAFENLNPFAEAQAFVGTPAPTSNTASEAEKQPFIGVARKAEFVFTATDDTLNLELINNVQEAKVNAIQITQINGTFVPPSDITAPVIEEITLENLLNVQDGTRELTVVVTDETGFDMGNVTGAGAAGITFTGFTPDAISTPSVTLSADGRTATLTYQVTGEGEAWLDGTTGEIAIAAGTFTDAAGNASAAASGGYVIQSNLDELVRGAVARAINLGTTATTPGDLGPDPLDGGTVDNNRYGGALTDTIITDAFGNPVTFEADSNVYHTSPKSVAQNNANVDGESGVTGSNVAGIDLDGSAYHTYRDSAAGNWTSTFDGFANGSYIVELHFAELFQGNAAGEGGANARVGGFSVNGTVFDDEDAYDVNGNSIAASDDNDTYDAFAAGARANGSAVGADTPTFIRKAVTVTDGTITVDVDASFAGQAGYSAIVIYDAVDPSAPASVSVSDLTVVEGDLAEVTFTRTGDLSEAVTIDYSVTGVTADASDFGTASPDPVVIAAGQATVTISFAITDDAIEEGAETISVTIDSATVQSTDPVTIADGSATVTIAASDSPFQTNVGTAIFDFDFEGVSGEVLEVTGFDGTLGDETFTLDTATSEVENGKLVVNTAEGDINDGTNDQNASINDFTKTVDVSDPALNELYLTARFDNPFTEAELLAQGITDGRLPNYAQQGIVFGTGTQLAGEMIKLVWGGVADAPGSVDALGVQMWSKGTGGVDQKVLFANMVAAGVDQFDVASIEMSMVIDKTAGTVGQYVTLFDATGAVLGGVRPEPTAGFATAAPVAMTQAVIDNLLSTTEPTHFGVTSSDNSNPAEGTFQSFEATWDVVNLSSPQYVDPGVPDDSVNGVATAGGDFSDEHLAPTDIGTLVEGATEITATQQGPAAEGGRERDFITFTVAEGQELTGIVLKDYTGGFEGGAVSQGFIAIQAGTSIGFDQDDPENTGAEIGNLLGGYIYSESDVQGNNFNDGNILDELGDGEEDGATFIGFEGALPAGTYTIWLNQGADMPKTVTLDLVTAAVVVPAITVSVASPADVVETGDFGTTELSFALTATEAFTGDITITYDTATATGETAIVSFVEGAATLTLSVANDNEDNGAESVSVTLTGAMAAGGTQTAEVDGTPASAQVTEDDGPVEPELTRGEVVFAINAGGPALTQDGIDFVAGPNAGSIFTGGAQYSDSGNGGGNNGTQETLHGTIYDTEINSGNATDATPNFLDANITFDGIDPTKSYYVDLYFAEIFSTEPDQRVFDVIVEGQAPEAGSVLDNIDPLARNGGDINAPLIIEIPDAIVPGANGTIDLSFLAVENSLGAIDRAKISAIVVREAVEVVESDATISVADITVSEGDGFAEVVFSREGDTSEAITITYEVADGTAEAGADYAAPVTNTITIAAGETSATLAIELLEDEIEEGDLGFTVTITDAASAGPVQLGNATASVTITDNDLPFGFAPDQDLDGDGIANNVDTDVDGDGVDNGDETFSYDATDAGTALINGESVTFDFDTPGTPFQNGLTGALWSPNDQAEEVNLETAEVSGGTLNINVNKGDHYSNNNNQENGLVAAFTAAEGLSVETRFAIPDFDNTTEGVQGSASPQSAGVVIGTDQNNLIKAVFGRQGGGFEFAQDNFNNNGNGQGNSFIDPIPEGATDVSIRLEVFLDEAGAAKARAFYTYYDAAGAIDGYEDKPFVTSGSNNTPLVRTIIDNPTGGTNLKTLIESGAPLGAGVIQTSTGGSTPAGFDVSYQYLTVTALGEPPARISLAGDATVVESGDTDSTTLVFDLVQVDGDPNGTVTVDFTVNDVAQSAEVTFVEGAATLEVSFANDEIDNGTESFDVVLTGASDGALLGDVTTATGTITEDDAAPVVDQGIAPQSTDEDAGFSFAVPADAFADLDTPDLTLTATLADGSDLPIWLTFADGTFTGTPLNDDVGDITVRVTASDGVHANVFTDFVISVANTNDAPEVTPIVADPVDEAAAPVTLDLLAGASDVDVGDTLSVDSVAATDGLGNPVAFTIEGSVISVDPTQFADALNDGDTETVTITYNVTDDNEGSTPNTATLTVTGLDPAQILSLADGPTVIEAGDDGVTQLVFTLTLSNADPEEIRTVDYVLDGTAASAEFTFTDGVATLVAEVSNDEIANGDDIIVMDLTGVSGDNTFIGGNGTATGIVTEDDYVTSVDQGIAGQSIDEDAAFSFAVPGDAFSDLDTPDLTLSVAVIGGGELPAWLSFDGTTFSGTPENDDVGDISLRVIASDGVHAPVFADFTISVANVNDAPVVVQVDSGPVLETDAPSVIDLLAGASDVDAGDALSVSDVTALDSNLDAVIFTVEGSQITIDPAQFADALDEGETETVTISFLVTDLAGAVTPGTATLAVTGRADARDWYLDADADGFGSNDPADIVSQIDQPLGYVDNNLDADDADDTVYPGAPEINDGKDNDQDGEIDEDNLAPAAGAETADVAQNDTLRLTRTELMSNDIDPEGGALSFGGVSNAVGGTVSYDATTGIVSFVPAADFLGEGSFDYTITDANGGVTVQTVPVTVREQLAPPAMIIDPAAVSDYVANQNNSLTATATVSEDGTALILNGNTWQGLALSEQVITADTYLSFTLSATAIPERIVIGFDNDDKWVTQDNQIYFELAGPESFPFANKEYRTYTEAGTTVDYRISLADYAGQSVSKLIFINDQDSEDPVETTFSNLSIGEIEPENLRPIAAEDRAVLENDAPLVMSAQQLLANDTDVDGDAFSLVGVANAQNGTVIFEGGRVTFTAAEGYTGPASFEYTIADAQGRTSTTTVLLTVVEPGTGDVITPVTFLGPITSYDTQDATPGLGAEVLNDGNSLQLTGNVWKKTDLADGPYAVTSNTVLRVDFTILAGSGEIMGLGLENDNRYSTNDDALFQLAGSQVFSRHANVDFRRTDLEIGETVSFEISLADYAGQSYSQIAFINDDDGQALSQIRFDNVQLVEVFDNGGTATDAPQIFGGTLADRIVLEDQPMEIDLAIFDPDTPLEDLTFDFEGLPAFASYANGQIIGLPGNDDVGTTTVTVTATDPEGNFVTGSFDLTVQNVNDAPTVTGTFEPAEVVVNSSFSLSLPADLFTDVDIAVDPTEALTYSATGLPAGVSINAQTGEISGTPTESQRLPYTVVITADDGEAQVSTTLSLKVLSGPPRESVLIEAEAFTGLTDGNGGVADPGFFKSFAAAASGRQVVRLNSEEEGNLSTDLDAAAVVPGLYDITVVYFDENDGVATLSVLLDTGTGTPQLLNTFDLNRTDLPGQGNGTQAGNITEFTIPSVDVPAGARLVLQGASDYGEFLRIDQVRLDPVENQLPEITSPASITVAENTTAVLDVTTTDAEGDAISYGIDPSVGDGALFAIDADTGALSFVTAPDFETPGDVGADGTYEVLVTASDDFGTNEQLVSVTVENANDAPTPTALLVDATAGLNQPIDLPALAELFADQDLDALTITATGLPAGVTVVDGVFTGQPTEQGNFTITVTADDGIADPVVATFDLAVVVDFGDVSPDEDLDGDTDLNATDPDVDGDGIANADDLFAYDADNGMLLGEGETRFYGFDIDGTIFENGMTGFLQATTNGGAYNEDTGATSVANGLLTVNPVTGGDTGNANNPEDDAVVGVKNGTFTATAVVLNPWVGAAPNPGGFDQLGLVLGLNSADMIKLVFGQTAGVVEFQKQEADVGTKFGGDTPNANVPLPAGVTLDNFDRAEITFDVVSTDATAASVTGSITFLLDDGTVVGALNIGAAPIGGALAAALADNTQGVAVGFTHADQATAPGFVAQMDSLEISTPGDGGGDGGDDTIVYRINAGGTLVAANDGGPAWIEDSIANPLQYLTVTDNRADAPPAGYTGDAGAIPVTLPEAVLDTARSSNSVFSYDIPVSELGGGENFEVRLYFAELFAGGQGGDFRNFDATLEGFPTAAFNNIDPGALFGADAGVLTAQVKVTDGVLNIGFAQDIKQNPIINGIEIVALSTDVENPEPPVSPQSALEAFAAQDDLATTETYGAGAIGSAVLAVMTGENNIQSSNFGANSFEVQNTGDKKISAIFIDVSSALYQDSVFDPDGQGGDNASKPWQINTDGNTGAFIDGSGYFLPGVDPIPNTTGTGGNSNGGFKGAMVKFSATDDGGFTNGETVGFSGDMDPNSIAGLTKASVDGSAILSWDVGGISGHELIGSLFTVLFDDGTTASGQLASDGSSAGSQALATQDTSLQGTAPGIAINGILPGENGTYGGTLPTITVTGDPGDRVQITMTKGFNPVVETSNGIADLVDARLDRYDFKASNAFDAQTVVVTIGEDGTFDASTLFDYDDPINNNVGSGSFAGDDVAQIGFVATKVAGNVGSLPVSATTAPIYLTSNGQTVVGDPTGGTGGVDGYFEIIGNTRFKVQVEDADAGYGATPGSNWTYYDGADGSGNQSGFQGDGYYVWKDGAITGVNAPQGALEYAIFVPEGQGGNYSFRARASRDEGTPGDQANDLWLKINDSADEAKVNPAPVVENGGFVKVFGASTGGWGFSGALDGEPDPNFAAVFTLEEGLNTITIAGRSGGYHLDFFEFYKGSAPNANASNSAFIEGEPGDTGGGGGDPVEGTVIIPIDSAADDWEQRGGAGSNDVELGDNGGPQYVGLRFDDIDIPEGSDLLEAYIRFTARESGSGTANFTIRIEDDETAAEYSTASQPGARSYVDDEFVWNAEAWTVGNEYDTVDISGLINDLIGTDGVENGAFGFIIEPVNAGASRVAEAFGSGNQAELVLVFEDDPFNI